MNPTVLDCKFLWLRLWQWIHQSTTDIVLGRHNEESSIILWSTERDNLHGKFGKDIAAVTYIVLINNANARYSSSST